MNASQSTTTLNDNPDIRKKRSAAEERQILKGGKRATRLSFFIAGFSLSCWAPLVPFAQARIQADSALLGTILLCLGLGAVIGMPTAGALAARLGSKFVIVLGAIGLVIALPLLTFVPTATELGASLLLFGASIGAIDVAAGIHGNEIQTMAKAPLMSGFHGMYSVGGLLGVSFMTVLIACGADLLLAGFAAATVILVSIVWAFPGFVATHSAEKAPLLVVPRGIVLIVGVLALITFLAEGAMLDWGAILLTHVKHVDVSIAGSGYAVFAVAMTSSRLVGDRLVALIGEGRTLMIGMTFTAAGFIVASFAEPFPIVLGCMALSGLAAGNIVPVLFTILGRQRIMPASHAIAAASMVGYLGILMGPALIGYAAQLTTLPTAFIGIAALLLFALIPVIKIAEPAK
ncbi:MFS transporter [Herbaspirillum sp. LeCh32-8]|nr:MFS transporter [Herbaspirillum sp. LeCh32-8]